MMTHNTWFIYTIIPLIFGYNIINSDGKSVDTVDIAMLHTAEDYRMKFVPTPQDFLKHLSVQPWMNNATGTINNPEAIEAAVNLQQKLCTERQEQH